MANATPRRTLLAPALLVAGVATLALLAGPAVSQQTRQKPTLRQRLVSGLQVRRPSEFAFIDAVIDTVDRGELPTKLVDRVFFWARSRSPTSNTTRRPIIYFQPGLTRLAGQLKITIRETPSGPRMPIVSG